MNSLKQLSKLEKLGLPMRLAAEKWDDPWKTLISTILSARTRDEKTIVVSTELFNKYTKIKSLANAKLRDIEKIIRPVNFYKTKAKNILSCAKVISEKYNGQPPHDFDKLIELSGVGRKTANVFLSEMGKDAIGVDTHVAYIAHKLGWTGSKKPEKIEEDLKRLFTPRYWKRINPILVRFGKSYSRKKQDEILSQIKKI